MSKLLRPTRALARIGKKPQKFQFNVTVQSATGVPKSTGAVFFEWKRGPKVVDSREASVRSDGAVEWSDGETLSLICTLYRDTKTQKFEDKVGKFSIKEAGRRSANLVGSTPVNLSDYATVDNSCVTRSFPLECPRGAVTVTVTLQAVWLKDYKAGDDAVSELSWFSVDTAGSRDEEDEEALADMERSTGRQSGVQTSPRAEKSRLAVKRGSSGGVASRLSQPRTVARPSLGRGSTPDRSSTVPSITVTATANGGPLHTSEMRSRQSDLERRVNVLEEQKRALEDQLRTSREHVESMNDDLQSVQEESHQKAVVIEELGKQLTNARAHGEETSTELLMSKEAYDNELRGLVDTVAQLKVENMVLRKKIAEPSSEMKTLAQQVTQLRTQLFDAGQRVVQVEKEKNDLQERFSQTTMDQKTALDAAQASREELELELSTLRARIQGKDNGRSTSEVAELRELVEKLQEKCKNAEKEADLTQSRRASEVEEELDYIRSELIKAKMSWAETEMEKEEYVMKCRDLRRAMRHAKDYHHAIGKNMTSLEVQLVQTIRRAEEAERQCEHLTTQLTNAREENEILGKGAENLEMHLADAHVSLSLRDDHDKAPSSWEELSQTFTSVPDSDEAITKG